MEYDLEEIEESINQGFNSTLTIEFLLNSSQSQTRYLLKQLRIVCRTFGATFYKNKDQIKIRNLPQVDLLTKLIDELLLRLELSVTLVEAQTFHDSLSIMND